MEHLEAETTLEKMMIQRASSKQSPISATLELLPLCNLKCKMCYVRLDLDEMKGKLLSLDEWLKIALEMQKSGVLFLLLTGGEPLLYPHFKELYLELKKMGFIITINSNGTIIDESWAEFFSLHKPRRINITLYGTCEETYRSLCGFEGFQKTIRGIELLKEKGVQVKINGSITKINYNEIDEIYAIGQKLNIPVAIDTYMIPSLKERNLDFDLQTRLLPEEAALARWKVLQHDLHPDDLHSYIQKTIYQIDENKYEHPSCISCMASNCSFSINYLGEMKPCVTFSEPFISVCEAGFKKSWEYVSHYAKQFHLNEKCCICPFRCICGTCVASAYLECGNYNEIPEYLCRYTKEYLNILKREIEK